MALDPLAAIEQAAQGSKLTRNLHTKSRLHRVNGAHLISNGADTTDASRDIGCLAIVPPAQKRFKKTWWLKYPELDILYLVLANPDIQRSFTFYTRQIVYFDRFFRLFTVTHAVYSPVEIR